MQKARQEDGDEGKNTEVVGERHGGGIGKTGEQSRDDGGQSRNDGGAV